jgi:hypothetical protein
LVLAFTHLLTALPPAFRMKQNLLYKNAVFENEEKKW